MKKKWLFLLSGLLSSILICCAPGGINLAYRKPVYHSSSQKMVDTGHLAVDGHLQTRWRAKPNAEQWIYIDLLKLLNVNRVVIRWDNEYAKDFKISVSADAKNWRDISIIKNSQGGVSDISFPLQSARYLKLTCLKQGLPSGYAVKEMEVYGPNPELEVKAQEPKARPIEIVKENKYCLRKGWRLENAAYVVGKGEDISRPGYDDTSWIEATVPGPVLTSYLDNHMLPNPYYADQQYMISESFSTSSFWYRNEFSLDGVFDKDFIWLNFEGINYEAEVFLNGKRLGTIKGAFIRGRFPIKDLIVPKGVNVLAVLIKPVPHPGEVSIQTLESPGPNGGEITQDGPTFISSVGWDWIPTIRGRNFGIWQDVWIEESGPVTLADPMVVSDLPLPRTDIASLTIKAELTNHLTTIQRVTLRVEIEDLVISKDITLGAKFTGEVSLSPAEFPPLVLSKPRLWWPLNFGKPELYPLKLSVITEAGLISHSIQTRFGVREIEVSHEGPEDSLVFRINGQKILIRGGNWGIDEAMKKSSDERMRYLMRFHQEAGLNMIRNWTGQTSQENFYALADEYGLLVWDDFWLANNSDGPDPLDTELFLSNARDKIKRFRIHPCIALWCCRNESEPPKAIEEGIREALGKYDGTRPFQRLSDEEGVTGNGPYSIQEPKRYFSSLATGFSTEIGLPCFPSEDSVRQMLPEEYLWKENDMWGIHDYCNGNMKAFYYTIAVARQFDKSSSITEFCKKAQMVNMESFKAIFEAWGARMWTKTTGVLLWMTNPAWPSLGFQIYDYFLEPTAGYFAVKKALTPVHILWDRSTDFITITNTTPKSHYNLIASAELYNIDGKLVSSIQTTCKALSNQAVAVFKMAFSPSLTKVHFLKLKLTDAQGHLISDNFYWRSKEEGVYLDLNQLPPPEIQLQVQLVKTATSLIIEGEVLNKSQVVALQVRLKPINLESCERLLPVFSSDNYFSLLPGERKSIWLEIPRQSGMNPKTGLSVEGFNLKPQLISLE